MDNLRITGLANDIKRTHVVGMLLDKGGRFMATLDVPVNINRVTTDLLPGDEAIAQQVAPEHRPKVMFKKKTYEKRGKDLITAHSGTVVRLFVEL